MVTARKKKKAVYFAIKRVLDLLFSVVGGGVTLLILPFVGLAIKIEDGGPIFFKQPRVGKNGKVFKLVKFRSMAVDNDVSNRDEEDKITKVGKILRKTSIDELPQLWNVFKGEMSLVGPRPWIEEYYKNMNAEQRRRQLVRPGMTGLAQVSGRNDIGVKKKIEYDMKYIDNISFWLDIRIVFMTIKTVFCCEGVENDKRDIGDEIEELRHGKKDA